MYTDSAYYHNRRSGFKDKTHPLFVESCGTYHLFTVPKLPTHRPKGRLDYQLLYIASGKGHFFIQGEEKTISAGNMVIYRPREEQRYYYYGADQTEVFWVHFTGNDVKNILQNHGITDDLHIIHSGTSLEYKHLFTQMIQELKLCRADYEELLINYFSQLLISLHRVLLGKSTRSHQLLANEMDAAVQYFHSNYNKPISIEAYASEHNMSISWFIRSFREYTNTTPAQYILSLRISNARTLLENTSYNISEISNIIGYDNPLYFSRLFKKQCGMSPSEFRKQLP
ncbi:MAG: AraC family transcriptional regulator [Fusicatenibacter sp.]